MTPRGWETGSTRVEGEGNAWRDEPEDRVLSFVYKEQQAAADPAPVCTAEETWRTKDLAQVAEIDSLLSRYGTCPRALRL